MTASPKEPKGALARYAFGYTNEKPKWSFWVIHVALLIAAFLSLSAAGFIEVGPAGQADTPQTTSE